MSELKFRTKVNILIVGILASAIVYVIIQVAFARILTDFVLGSMGNNSTLFLIILGFFSIALLSSVAVSIWTSDNIAGKSVWKAALVSFLLNFILIIVISYVGMFMMYPEVFSELRGFENIIAFPTVIVYFSIYVLGQVIYLFVISVISYYIFYIIFLDIFYEYKSRYRW